MKTPAFLTLSAVAATATFAQADVNFEEEILPLIESTCVDCHRAPYEEDGRLKKPKGGLRMDGRWAIELGGDNGGIVVPGEPDRSEMLVRAMLPDDDDDFMPPKGEPWTDEQKALISAWITEGADFGEWEGNQEGRPEEPEEEEVHVSWIQTHYESLAEGLEPVSEDAIKAVSEAGGRATPLAVGNPLLSVDFLVERESAGDEAVAALSNVSDNVAQLDLSRTQVTDAALETVGSLPRLTRLSLHNTAVSDEGLSQLTGLENLTYLNLYGTQVSDAGLEEIGKIPSLRSVYLWQSQVTENGAKKLQEALPEAQINWK